VTFARYVVACILSFLSFEFVEHRVERVEALRPHPLVSGHRVEPARR